MKGWGNNAGNWSLGGRSHINVKSDLQGSKWPPPFSYVLSINFNRQNILLLLQQISDRHCQNKSIDLQFRMTVTILVKTISKNDVKTIFYEMEVLTVTLVMVATLIFIINLDWNMAIGTLNRCDGGTHHGR